VTRDITLQRVDQELVLPWRGPLEHVGGEGQEWRIGEDVGDALAHDFRVDRSGRAGTPPTTAPGGTLRVTHAPAATTDPAPMTSGASVDPLMTLAPIPRKTLSSIVTVPAM
jgi:hypothetical protein